MKSPQYTREIPQRYRLEAEKCRQCGKVHFPPRLICDACQSQEFEQVILSRAGRILTWTVIHVPPTNFDLEAPYIIAIVELEEGVRLTCQVVDCDPEELAVDAPVEMVFRRIQEDSQADIIQYGYKAVLSRP
ncbi:MAG: Zn-ribbon domain-containing OB-fold protein [Fidelibacterota bacterium]|nr:MAG: Zn-ribbon domain-containing OB-fold protein [Candidatus Neomarinimicrobiota bacterium]